MNTLSVNKWIPVEGKLSHEILLILRKIISKYKEYKDPDDLYSLLIHGGNRGTEAIEQEYWTDGNLGSSSAGICLLMGKLDHLFPTEEWDIAGHKYLEHLKRNIEDKGIYDLSLYNGLAGILVGVRALSRNGTRYANMLNTLISLYEEMLIETVEFLKKRWRSEDVQMSEYDTISGLTGIGRVVLMFPERQKMKEIWGEIECLFHLFCGEKDFNGSSIPRWHIAASNQFHEHERLNYPNGNFNMGISHGIAGPLSLMSISVLQGLGSDRLLQDIYKLSEWLSSWIIHNQMGTFWPSRVSYEELQRGELNLENRGFRRDSWCYGVPGIARALWLAGSAVNNKEWSELALSAFLGIENRLSTLGGLTSAPVCHGVAGLIQSVQRMYSETGDKRLESMRDRLIRSILDMYEPEALFGYYDINEKFEKVNDPGFLNGNAGIALVLASLISDENPKWDSVLVIS